MHGAEDSGTPDGCMYVAKELVGWTTQWSRRIDTEARSGGGTRGDDTHRPPTLCFNTGRNSVHKRVGERAGQVKDW